MYEDKYKKDDEPGFRIVIPWDKNTARGLAVAITLCLLLLIIFTKVHPPAYDDRFILIKSVPLELLNLGEGDGTGKSKGNLTPEGAAHLGEAPLTNIHDAATAEKKAFDKNSESSDETEASTYLPVTELKNNRKSEGSAGGKGDENVGTKNGESWGMGLGDKGTGKGLGSGFGDIEWGGGGNRIVLSKQVPKFPKNVKTSATIKVKFYVQPDGSVSKIIPLQKADPELERAVIEALKKWRFNPIKSDVVMVGTIPITFILR
ncbi:MAG: TonB family protein [bacterium]